MRTVGLWVLGLLCLHSWVLGQAEDVVEELFCDDPAVTEAVSNALDKFNEKISGHKLALYQILEARKTENVSDSVYSIEFSSRISDCLARSDKHWKECDYLSDGRKDPSPCNATVHVTKTKTETTEVHCHLAEHVVPERANCMGCPEDIHEDSEDLKVPLTVSITKFNAKSDSTHLFTLNAVGHATRQVVAGFRYKLSFDMRKSTCAKSENKDLHDLCVPDPADVELAHCNSTVDVAPWRHEVPEAHVSCEPGPMPATFSRRRPPGWSPLRNLVDLEVVPETTHAPITAPAKEESSEEALTLAKAQAVMVEPGPNPIHCPSKPWKHFSPLKAVTTAGPVAEPASVPPKMEGTFHDLDLLG
ncbi:kininogen-1 [Diretmus argenteus]